MSLPNDGEFLTWLGPRIVEFQRRPRPTAGPGEVVLKVEAVGLCGSDIDAFEGRSKNRVPPLVLGHEMAGRVVDADGGEGVLCAVSPLSTCLSCAACRSGRTNLCPDRRLLGLHRDGGLAGYVVVPRDRLWPVPGLSPSQASLVEPLANAVHLVRIAISSSRAWPPREAAVIGAGGQGIMNLQVLRHFGVHSVTSYDPDPNRREAALRVGATAALDPSGIDLPGAPDRLDLVVDTVGSSASRHLGQQLVAAGGTFVWLGLHERDAGIDALDLVAREIVVRGSYAYTDIDVDTAVLLAGQPALDLESWITVLPMRAAPELLLGTQRPTKLVFRP